MITVESHSETFILPQEMYGIELRPHKPADFIAITVWGLIALAGVSIVLSHFIMGTDPRWALGGAFGGVIAALLSWACLEDLGGRKRQASELGQARFAEWQKNTLIPFLENKYGVKFKSNFAFSKWGYPSIVKDNRSFKVKIDGIRFARRSFGGGDHYFYFPVQEDGQEIELVEIVKPEQVSYRTLEAV